MANSLEIAPTSPNYVRALTDSLKAPYPITLACLIPPSLPLGGSCVAPTFGVVIGFLFCLPLLTFCCLYIELFLCLFVWCNSALGLRCYDIKIISYHNNYVDWDQSTQMVTLPVWVTNCVDWPHSEVTTITITKNRAMARLVNLA